MSTDRTREWNKKKIPAACRKHYVIVNEWSRFVHYFENTGVWQYTRNFRLNILCTTVSFPPAPVFGRQKERILPLTVLE